MCSSITGALAANAVFKGVGVGDETASAVAATTSWILRDGLSKCSAIAFAYYKGSRMDSECKKYRLLADGLNDLAMGVNLASPFLPPFYRNMVYCLSSVCWSIVGIAGGCTRTAMTIHQARKDNASDVQVKPFHLKICMPHISKNDETGDVLFKTNSLLCLMLYHPTYNIAYDR